MPYNVPRKKSRSYKKNAFDNNLLKLVSSILVLIIGITLAGLLALKLYLISLPPIKNLNSLKPNIVTTFCASDGEVIKTFAAYAYSNVELKEVPETLTKALIATEDKPDLHHPIAAAAGIPCKFPVGEVDSVLKSPCASNQITAISS